MAYFHLVALFSTVVLSSFLNIVQGSSSLSLTKTENANHITDITMEAKDDATLIVENFKKMVEKHADEMTKFRSLYPDIDGNKQFSMKIYDIIQHRINSVVKIRTQDTKDNERGRERHRDRQTDVTADDQEFSTPILKNFSNLIERHVVEIEKFLSLHPDIHANKQLSSRINEILQDHIKIAIKSVIRNKISDIINSARFSNTASHNELTIHNSRTEHANKQSNEESSSAKKTSEHAVKDKNDDRLNINKITRRGKIQSLVHEFAGTVKELKSTIKTKIKTKNTILESKLNKKFYKLREITQNSALTRSNDFDSNKEAKRRSDVTGGIKVSNMPETDNFGTFDNTTWEKLGSVLKNVQSSEKAFAKSKAEMILAAKHLHEPSNVDNKSSYEQDTKFDIQKLETFRSKLQKMILLKAQYINDTILLKQKLNKIFNNSDLDYSTSPASFLNIADISSSSSRAGKYDELQDSFSINADGKPNSQNYAYTTESNGESDEERMKMAVAGYRGNDATNNDGDSSTIVVLTVLACLVMSAVIGVLVVMVWRKNNRHRLYVRIPGGNSSSPTSGRYNN